MPSVSMLAPIAASSHTPSWHPSPIHTASVTSPDLADGTRVETAQYLFAADPELDEDELDKEINGYRSDTEDELTVEFDSDNVEIVGVVYNASDEALGGEEFTFPAQTLPIVSGARDSGSYEEGHSPGQWQGDDKPLESVARQPASAKASCPGATAPFSSLKRKRENSTICNSDNSEAEESGDSSDGETSDSSEDEEDNPAPPTKQLRMTKVTAESLRQAAIEFTCGIQGCGATYNSWKTAKAHLDAIHYAGESASGFGNHTAASDGKGKAVTKSKSKGKENCSSPSVYRPKCLYPGCGKGYRSINSVYRHIMSVHWKINRAACPYCPKTYSRMPLVRQHILAKHKGRPFPGAGTPNADVTGK
ncbi:hypothetical protein GY45DRAFT_1338612 [Cubamyces sp. BRFM 1775]|nr:hypothetical protein GY45DRAFT_1338612 [Cubamyces sp. BRFM 1775]